MFMVINGQGNLVSLGSFLREGTSLSSFSTFTISLLRACESLLYL